jgi:hypothetical protein
MRQMGIDDAGFILSAQGIYQIMTKGVRCDLSPDQIKWQRTDKIIEVYNATTGSVKWKFEILTLRPKSLQLILIPVE